MSGHCTGVQQCIREVAPYVLYVHCYTNVSSATGEMLPFDDLKAKEKESLEGA